MQAGYRLVPSQQICFYNNRSSAVPAAAEDPSAASVLSPYCPVQEELSHSKPPPSTSGAAHRNSQRSVNYSVVPWNSSFLPDFSNWLVRTDLALQTRGGLNSLANDSVWTDKARVTPAVLLQGKDREGMKTGSLLRWGSEQGSYLTESALLPS